MPTLQIFEKKDGNFLPTVRIASYDDYEQIEDTLPPEDELRLSIFNPSEEELEFFNHRQPTFVNLEEWFEKCEEYVDLDNQKRGIFEWLMSDLHYDAFDALDKLPEVETRSGNGGDWARDYVESTTDGVPHILRNHIDWQGVFDRELASDGNVVELDGCCVTNADQL